MTGFIDDHRDVYGVEPICRVLPIAPSTYHAQVARRADSSKDAARTRRDIALRGTIQRVFDENFSRLRRPQGLAADDARGRECGAMHGRSADEGHGFAERDPRLTGEDEGE
ncbi:hypothetical protein QOZ94_004310 [Xanthobacter agilis]|uniref:Transposase n=1 Tax=Xanthobacter agilis TaxID=47492 RepID=A0ABU0LK24_XANAG|nr:hypothetical protein [Xanthobacter agilis]